MNEGVEIEVEVNTDMCECIPQWVVTEACPECGKFRYKVNDEINPDHYGPYGANCMHSGQFDAGECWICTAKRKQVERDEALLQLDYANKELELCNSEGVADLEMRFEKMKTRSGEMQLVAGRYQYQFEKAMKLINRIDDMFEYRFKHMDGEMMQAQAQAWLKEFTDAVKIKKEFKLKG